MDDGAGLFRALTWNIHRCVGRDGKQDAGRIGAFVNAIAPDIAAFQEVAFQRDSREPSPIHHDLRTRVGAHGHEAWSLTSADGRYGQMLASRFPLERRQVHDISMSGREPRKVMESVAQLPSGPIRVIATHLGLGPRERRWQMDRLYDIVVRDLALPIILLGDLNEWRARTIRRHPLFLLFGAFTSHASFPSRLPILPIDRICCRPAELLTRSRVVKEANLASDHLPVVAEFRLT